MERSSTLAKTKCVFACEEKFAMVVSAAPSWALFARRGAERVLRRGGRRPCELAVILGGARGRPAESSRGSSSTPRSLFGGCRPWRKRRWRAASEPPNILRIRVFDRLRRVWRPPGVVLLSLRPATSW